MKPCYLLDHARNLAHFSSRWLSVSRWPWYRSTADKWQIGSARDEWHQYLKGFGLVEGAWNRNKRIPMWYSSTKSLLESIVRWLKADDPQDDAEWQAQTDLVQACLAEMVEMSEPTVNPPKGATPRYVHRPVADKLNRAMPHVRFMLTAMRDRDRTTALAHGETTLRRL
jgi:hypothetical protein